MTACGKRSVYAALIAGLVSVGVLVVTAGSATAGQDATVIGVSPIPGTTLLNVGVEIPKSVAMTAYNDKRAWGLDVAVTYMSINNKIVTVDSGVVSILNDTQIIGPVDSNTVAIQLNISDASVEPPGGQPSYSSTATLIKP
jgi:hypothetical protein